MKKVFNNDTFSIVEDGKGKLYIYKGPVQMHSGNKDDILAWLSEFSDKRRRLDEETVKTLYRKINHLVSEIERLENDIRLQIDNLQDFQDSVSDVKGFLYEKE